MEGQRWHGSQQPRRQKELRFLHHEYSYIRIDGSIVSTTVASWAQTAPGPLKIVGRKLLTLVSNDPPGQWCSNILVASELPNTYKVPIVT